MSLLKATSGVLAMLAVSLLVFGGAGFSQVAAERGLQVSVVPDDEALIGYESVADETVTDGETDALIEVTNRAPGDISVVDVSVDSQGTGDLSVDVDDYPTEISPGDSETVTAEIGCEEPTEATLAVTVEVSGEGLQAEIYGETRTFELTCEPPPEEQTGVRFTGQGNAKVTESPDNPARVEIWAYNASDGLRVANTTSVGIDQPIRPRTDRPRDFTIVAVHFVEEDVTYAHPDYTRTNSTLSTPTAGGAGVAVEISPDNW